MTDITNIIVDGSFEDGLTEQWQIIFVVSTAQTH